MKVVGTLSTINQAEASKPLQQKKMQECNRCKTAGYPNQMIGFEKTGQDAVTGKFTWKLVDENGREHKHKLFQDSIQENPVGTRPLCSMLFCYFLIFCSNFFKLLFILFILQIKTIFNCMVKFFNKSMENEFFNKSMYKNHL